MSTLDVRRGARTVVADRWIRSHPKVRCQGEAHSPVFGKFSPKTIDLPVSRGTFKRPLAPQFCGAIAGRDRFQPQPIWEMSVRAGIGRDTICRGDHVGWILRFAFIFAFALASKDNRTIEANRLGRDSVASRTLASNGFFLLPIGSALMNLTQLLRFLGGALAIAVPATISMGDVVVSVNPAGTTPPLAVTGGYSISYTPNDAIGPAPSGFTYWSTWAPTDNWFGLGYDIIQSHYVLGQAPNLDITVGGLSPQNYEVFATIYTNSGQFPSSGEPYPAAGSILGLSATSTTVYSHASGGTLLASVPSGSSVVGNYEVRVFDLGSEFATGGNIDVFLDRYNFAGKFATSNLAELRLAPTPEPSSFVLAALAFAGFAAWGWRRHTARVVTT